MRNRVGCRMKGKLLRSARAFTLAETMIVVALVAILAAAGVAGGERMIRNGRLSSLDREAETIYIAAQQHLTAMEVSDRMGELTVSTIPHVNTQRNVVDLATGNVTPKNATVYTLTSSSPDAAAVGALFPEGVLSEELLHGNWYVTYDGEAAVILDVFYSTADQTDYFTKNIISGGDDKRRQLMNRDERLSDGGHVGYYGGEKVIAEGAALDVAKLLQLPDADKLNPDKAHAWLVLQNDEEFAANLFFRFPTNPDKAYPYYEHDTNGNVIPGQPKPVTFTLTMKDQDGHTAVSGPIVVEYSATTVDSATGQANQPVYHTDPADGNYYRYRLVLDSLKTGSQFKDFLAGCASNDGLVAGQNLTFTLSAECEGYGAIEPADKALSAVNNPLFDFPETRKTGVTYVGYGRHLQNLDSAISGVALTKIRVVQDRAINFGAVEDDTRTHFQRWDLTYPGMSFTPIYGDRVSVYDGNNSGILNMLIDFGQLHIGANDAKEDDRWQYIGMFSQTNGEIMNVAMKDCKIVMRGSTTHSNEQSAMLVGFGLNGAKIHDCTFDHVIYEDRDTIRKYGGRAIAVGRMSGATISRCTAKNCSILEFVSSAGVTRSSGILVGVSDGGTIDDCIVERCALLLKTGDRHVGALVAIQSSGGTVTIRNSKALGVINYQAGDAGGLVGMNRGTVNISGCSVELRDSDVRALIKAEYDPETYALIDDVTDVTDEQRKAFQPEKQPFINATNAGGLVGECTYGSTNISNSYASTVVQGSTRAGGLIGLACETTVDGSYADCYLSGSTVGGLVATLRQPDSVANTYHLTVTDSYSAGFILPGVRTTSAGGITCASDTTVTVTNSVSLFNFDNIFAEDFTGLTYKDGLVDTYPAKAKAAVSDPKKIYPLVNAGTVTNSYYTYGGDVAAQTNMGVYQTFAQLAEMTSGGAEIGYRASDNYPYLLQSQLDANAKLPNFLPALPHYGDFLEGAVDPSDPEGLYARVYLDDGGTAEDTTDDVYTLAFEKGKRTKTHGRVYYTTDDSGNRTFAEWNGLTARNYPFLTTETGWGNDANNSTIRSFWGTSTYRSLVTKVYFDDSFTSDSRARPRTISAWFAGFSKVKEFTNIEKLNLSQCKGFGYVFQNCSSVESLDLSAWNTSAAQTMSAIFHGCSALKTLNVSGWDTSKVMRMNGAFRDTVSLTSLDLHSWNTQACTTFQYMFAKSAVTDLDLSRFSLQSGSDFQHAFREFSGKTIDMSGWEPPKIVNIYGAFHGAKNLTTIYAPYWFEQSKLSCDDYGGVGPFKTAGDLLVGGADFTSKAGNYNDVWKTMCAWIDGKPGNPQTSKGSYANGFFTYLVNYTVSIEDGISGDVLSTQTYHTRGKGVSENTLKETIIPSGLDLSAYVGVYADPDMTTAISNTLTVKGYANNYKLDGVSFVDESDGSDLKYSVKLYARPDGYGRVTLDENYEGGKTTVKYVKLGKTLPAPDVSAREGYTLAGWYTDEELTSQFDFSLPVTTDITLYAKWVQTATVTFHANGHGTEPAAVEVEIGGTCGTLPTMSADGYTFDGWYTDSDTFANAFTASTTVTADVEVYAKWEESGGGFVVEGTKLTVSPSAKEGLLEEKSGFDGYLYKRLGLDVEVAKTITEIDLSNLSGIEITDMRYWFMHFVSLKTINFGNLDTSKVTDMYGLFSGCSSLETIDISSFNFSGRPECGHMFYDCTALKTIYANPDENYTYAFGNTTGYEMFDGCKNLVGGNNTAYSSSKTNKEYARIDRVGSPGYFTAK